MCVDVNQTLQFIMSNSTPKATENCQTWYLMEDARANGIITDQFLAKKLSLYPRKANNLNSAWKNFQPLFKIVNGLITYIENFKEFLHETLLELLNDNVQYVEFRTSLTPVCILFH